MALEDTVCTLVPYFTIHDGKVDEFKALGEKLVEQTKSESGVVFYGFGFNGNRATFREGYADASAILQHLGNVDELLKQVLEIADLDLVEVHAPQSEIDALREPLEGLAPKFFAMEAGFRR